MSPFLVPTTTSPWIWPSNGKIIRGPLPKFLIPTIFGGFQRCIYDYFSYIHRFSFVSRIMVWYFMDDFLNWLIVNISYFLYVDLLSLFMILFLLLGILLWFINFWVIWFYHGILGSLLASPPFKDPYTLLDFGCFLPLSLVYFHEYFVLWCLSCHSPFSYEVSSWYFMFCWVFQVVTLRLPFVFLLGISYSKSHGLTWD